MAGERGDAGTTSGCERYVVWKNAATGDGEGKTEGERQIDAHNDAARVGWAGLEETRDEDAKEVSKKWTACKDDERALAADGDCDERAEIHALAASARPAAG